MFPKNVLKFYLKRLQILFKFYLKFLKDSEIVF